MNLSPIPPDPEPSGPELEEHLPSLTKTAEEVRLRIARFFWRIDKLKGDPNAFLVNSVTAVRKFPDRARDYDAYLASARWQRIRGKALKLAEHRCAGCLAEATEVHHRDYRPRVLTGDDLSPLVPLCGDCHHRVHHDERGEKRSSWEACERALADMVAAKPYEGGIKSGAFSN